MLLEVNQEIFLSKRNKKRMHVLETIIAVRVSFLIPCPTVSHCVSPCFTVSHRVSLCLTMSHCVSPCLTASHPLVVVSQPWPLHSASQRVYVTCIYKTAVVKGFKT